jgi:enhancing lycopene biosynthesis protein 2
VIRAGILLSGLGYADGSDIDETVLTALFLSESDAEAVFTAPDCVQRQIKDHRSAKMIGGERNVLAESSRITRTAVRPVDRVEPTDLDILIIPGGLGVLTNLCDFSARGENCTIDEGVRHLVGGMVRRKRPVGAISHGILLLALVLKGRQGISPTLTFGNDAQMSGHIQLLGGMPIPTKADEALVDEQNRLVSTAGAASGAKLAVLAEGIGNLVRGTLELVHRGERDERSTGTSDHRGG